MRKEIIDSIIQNGDSELFAMELDGYFVVRYVPKNRFKIKGIGEYMGISQQFHKDPARTKHVCGIAYISWHEASTLETVAIDWIISRKMARHWVRIGRRAEFYRKADERSNRKSQETLR